MTTAMVPCTNGPHVPMVTCWTKLVLYDQRNRPMYQWSHVEPNWFYVTIAIVQCTNGPKLNQIGSIWPLQWSHEPMVTCWTKLVLYDQCNSPMYQWSHVEPNWFYMTIAIIPCTNGPKLNQIGSIWPLQWSHVPMVLSWTKLVLYDHCNSSMYQWS